MFGSRFKKLFLGSTDVGAASPPISICTTTALLILEGNRSRSCHHHSSPRFTATAFSLPSSRLCSDPSRCVVASGLSPPSEIRCSCIDKPLSYDSSCAQLSVFINSSPTYSYELHGFITPSLLCDICENMFPMP
ncbi:hypothetical protein AHAS_Ahas11G0238600 [Arachis hypogaea]